jgi:hypothetical protein
MQDWLSLSTARVIAIALGLFSVSVFRLQADVVRAPLMGHVLSTGGSASWLSETRIVNPNPQAAIVTITDVVGTGNPAFREFTIDAYGVLDLRNFELFFDTDPPGSYYPTFLALVEFTSDQPIIVLTQISASEPQSVAAGVPCVYLPQFGGDCFRPLAGPLLRGFRDYVPTGVVTTLPWLTAGIGYRDNLFLTNPSEGSLEITASFRSPTGEMVATKTYVLAPRSLSIVSDALRDESIAGSFPDGAVTASFAGNGPFYVFAAVISESLGCGVQPLYALVQQVQ